MNFKDKNVLVVGLARSGLASVKALSALGARITANDSKSKKELGDVHKEIDNLGLNIALGVSPEKYLKGTDLMVISPGVSIYSPFVQRALEMGIGVIGEVELAYMLSKAPIIAITGTNGKTTTTSLTGEILKRSGIKTYIVGNIGIPFVGIAGETDSSDAVVAEISSFQLETIKAFHPRLSAVLNIKEDHLDRHKSMENYINIKARVFENAGQNDWLILNAHDPLSSSLADRTKAKTFFFSRSSPLKEGAWIEDGFMVIDIGDGKERVCPTEDIFIPGPHNLENALAAALISRIWGAPVPVIAQTLRDFRGVEHRIELVKTLNGITFYNDSKGTNIDSTIKAIESMKGPTVLIAGGYDKGSSFQNLFLGAFPDVVNHLVVLGQTSDKIEKAARDRGFKNIHRVKSLEEGVKKAYALGTPGGNVLLSPACASWDMFRDFEERGRVFKEAVRALEEENK